MPQLVGPRVVQVGSWAGATTKGSKLIGVLRPWCQWRNGYVFLSRWAKGSEHVTSLEVYISVNRLTIATPCRESPHFLAPLAQALVPLAADRCRGFLDISRSSSVKACYYF
jgi:hypothetical protein